MGKKCLWMLGGISAVALLCGSVSLRAQRPGPTVYVALWFDTEDYILPQSAEAAEADCRIAEAERYPGDIQIGGRGGAVL